jgi:signal transduction histidine kinase
MQWFGFPVQLLRSALAGAAALFIVRFLRAFDFERARRLSALKEAQVREIEGREALRRDLLRRTVRAQEAERQRIGRELHDETGQALTALGLGLRGIKSRLRSDPALAERHAAELEALAARSLDELRRLVADLRPSQLDDLGLVAALRWYTQEVARRAGLGVAFVTACPRLALPAEQSTVLFRIAQEALTNVVKHARAQHATLHLACDAAGAVALSIKDDGCGFDLAPTLAGPPGRPAWGLLGMQERATLAGGHLRVWSEPGRGTEVVVTLPLEHNANGQDQIAVS